MEKIKGKSYEKFCIDNLPTSKSLFTDTHTRELWSIMMMMMMWSWCVELCVRKNEQWNWREQFIFCHLLIFCRFREFCRFFSGIFCEFWKQNWKFLIFWIFEFILNFIKQYINNRVTIVILKLIFFCNLNPKNSQFNFSNRNSIH